MSKLMFFCDIRNTITGKNNVVNLEELELFFDKLYHYALSINCDKVIFSLISSDSKKDVLNEFKKITKINPNIEFGRQFYEGGYFEIVSNEIKFAEHGKLFPGKMAYIKEYMDELHNDPDISTVCYADDSVSELHGKWLSKICKELDSYSIKPSSTNNIHKDNYIETTSNGIYGTMECFDKIIAKNKVENKNII